MRILPAAVAAAALGMTGAAAMAATSSPQDIDIRASKLETLTVRHSRTGIQDEVVQLSRQVSYADLDLATKQGAHELENRIHQTAAQVCDRLGSFYTDGSFFAKWEADRQCVQGAVDGAMQQAKVAVATAKQERFER
jgi:UrcA family protein